MKKILFLLLSAMLAIGTNAQNAAGTQTKADEGVHFLHGTYEEALAEAKRQGKMLFVDVWATWCGPCVRLGKEIFPQKAVGDFFNANFVCYKLQTDPSDPAAKAHAAALEKKWGVQAIPALFWIDPADGEVVYSTLGFMPSERLLAEARKALDPSQNLSRIKARWNGGDRSLESGLIYFDKISKDQDEILQWYKTLTPEQQVNAEMREFIHHMSSWHTPTYQYIASRWNQYAQSPQAGEWKDLVTGYIEQTASSKTSDDEFRRWADEWRQYGLDFYGQAFDAAQIYQKMETGQVATSRDLLTAYVKHYGLDHTIYRYAIRLYVLKSKDSALDAVTMPRLNGWTEELAKGKTGREQLSEAYLYRGIAYSINGSREKMQKLTEELKTADVSDDVREILQSFYDNNFADGAH